MRHFVPAAGHPSLLALYDPLTKLLGADSDRAALLEQAALTRGHRVLDVGCGTGTLVVQASRAHPGIEIVGLDPDRDALARARRKASRAGVDARFVEGFADALPWGEGSFDRVVSSLMFHHLPDATKPAMLREVRRVLVPGGTFHLLDFVPRERSWLSHRLAWNHHARGNAPAAIVELLRDAGFASAEHVTSRDALLGRTGYFRARRD
ncbi:class I SAM-dependent methyltransferase [Sandaracinus amylolyticus]|uniref:class I SAM-dependent methyltransferase n=1 Tax=Sandaracinus amylolyticus TaxID=927083 RepID=UPI001F460E7B|nr:class I SAM-dependent methyltransferase [Sandaracinus amylolyticus]UJR85152.1 Hypothetical protein I5071_72320 [Sandaracinus amylolyticus]